ncbi:transcriptional repressor LexA [Litorivicinus lipolyticus]|uniref:LexA repressor n=1 Tax=Litorivicinus lipolyticus TaxID=418701 RepID=A0A5Q2Q7E4_9GAMM|nr:transcriptional repressor LexA [Litorivicinus lipolyticus]QGG80379.1 transcriptional repressor LexA [Litorivicinus lipolyticus]
MQALSPGQERVYDQIRKHMGSQGVPPTRAELARDLGFRSANAAEEHLKALARKGYIELTRGASRGIRLLLDQDEGIPLIGKVAAGMPISSEANIEAHIDFPAALFGALPDYLLRVDGDSMIGIGIMDGDILGVATCETAQNGDIVVARVNEDVTVKRFQRNAQGIELIAENPSYAPIKVGPADEFRIEGKMLGLVRT